MQAIQHENYSVTYNEETSTIVCSGSFRLHTPEYNEILDAMRGASKTQTGTVTLDLRSLQFLNSSGINMVYKFVMDTRDDKSRTLLIKGSRQIPWQQKTLKNLTKLWPELQLEIE